MSQNAQSDLTDQPFSIDELRDKIFLYPDYQSILNACKMIPDICNDDILWKRLGLRDYSNVVADLKPVGESFREQYEYLYNTDMGDAILDCRLDGVIANYNKGVTIDESELYYICDPCKIYTLLELGIFQPTVQTLYYALRKGSIDLLNYLKKYSILPTSNSLLIAVTNDNLNVIEWAKDQGVEMTGYLSNKSVMA